MVADITNKYNIYIYNHISYFTHVRSRTVCGSLCVMFSDRTAMNCCHEGGVRDRGSCHHLRRNRHHAELVAEDHDRDGLGGLM